MASGLPSFVVSTPSDIFRHCEVIMSTPSKVLGSVSTPSDIFRHCETYYLKGKIMAPSRLNTVRYLQELRGVQRRLLRNARERVSTPSDIFRNCEGRWRKARYPRHLCGILRGVRITGVSASLAVGLEMPISRRIFRYV